MTNMLAGKVALVTGAGRMRGTGHSIAVALAEAGCDLVLHGSGSTPDRWPESERAAGWRGLDSVQDKITALGRRATKAIAELTRRDEVDRMIEEAAAHFGRLDIIVNNAAASTGGYAVPVTELSDEDWRRTIAVKLDGAFYCSRAAARQMLKQGEGGSIVNIASVGGKLGLANASAYSVANAGMQMLGAVMARELGPQAITVNSLCVGQVDTSRSDGTGAERLERMLNDHVPLRRVGLPSEIGDLVVFLCGPGGRYITGQSINIDGGWVIH